MTRILRSRLNIQSERENEDSPLTRVGNSDHEQFLQDIVDQFNRLETSLVENRVPHEELAACYGGSQPNINTLILQVRQSAHPDQLVQVVPYI